MTQAQLSQPQSLSAGLQRLLGHLSKRRRWQLSGLVVLMLVGAVAELATLGAVLPFLALLADPSLATRYPLLQQFFVMLGWGSDKSILLPTTILFAGVAMCAAAMRMHLLWVSSRFSFAVGVDIGVELYRRTLYQPYSFHVSRNSSEIIAGTNKVSNLLGSVLNPLIQAIVAGVLAIAMFGALMSIDPVTAAVAGTGFSVIYIVVTFSTRRRLRNNGRVIAETETLRVQAVQEGLGGIRDVLIDGLQEIYVKRFQAVILSQCRAQAVNSFIGIAPRYLIESIGMVLIAGIAFGLSQRTGGVSAALPVLGALALGAQKIMPQMQQIYFGVVSVSGSKQALFDVLELLEQPIPDEYATPLEGNVARLARIITLRNLSFRYRQDTPEVIRELNLEIPRGSRVGFIGKTGSGKSTVIDLIMGLLEPTSGSVEIDGHPLSKVNRRAWQSQIAHVPQTIYLADSTIAENIAFGVDVRQIDHVLVQDAARKAQLAEFIDTLPAKYQTSVGERGVRLSGGQRQRIGLARALYKKADVLILDEATSALDDATEKLVMRALNSLGEDITVLMIAHRISTLSHCSRIYELDKGGLLRESEYHEIIDRCT